MIQLNPEQEKNLKDRIAAIQLKTGIVMTPDVMKQLMVQLAVKDPVAWGMTYRNLKGEPYRFELPSSLRADPKLWNRHRPFLKQMLQDQAKNKCYEKSRQCGASESSVTEVLWFLSCHKATKAVYVFPTQQQMEDFSNSRIDPCLDESEYLKGLRGKIDNVKMKQIGSNSFLVMRSGQTSRAGEGVDADALFIDEKDRMSDKIEAAFEQSLSSSSFALLREFSTPTLPGVGVDKSFQASCQYHWHVKCESGHWQTLTYDPSDGGNIKQLRDLDPAEEVIPPGSFELRCTHKGFQGEGCPSKIDRWNGEWIATHDDHRKKTHAGYHINQLSCVWISIDGIMQQMRKYQFMDAFYNYVLGIPYSSNEGLITEEALKACLDQTQTFPNFRRQTYNAVVAGIDWGRLNWCVVLGRRADGKWEVCGLKYVSDHTDVLVSAKALGEYLQAFNPNYIVADFGYGRDRCMELQRQYPERVYACLYSSGRATDTTFNPAWQEGQLRVTVNRTAHLRWMLEFIKRRKVVFPGRQDDYDKFFKHIMNLALIHEEEEDPKTKESTIVERIGKKGDDHYAHAMAYAVLAAQKLTHDGGFFYEFLAG